MQPKYLNVGKVVNTHGIKGDLKIVPRTDFAEIRFRPGSHLILMDEQATEQREVIIESAREHKGSYIVHFESLHDINEVEKYKGWNLKVSEEQRVDLPEGEYYYYEIIGCKVLTEDGEQLGTIGEILTPGANDVWVVEQTNKKQLLLPVIDDVIIDVLIDEKKVIVRLMEGM